MRTDRREHREPNGAAVTGMVAVALRRQRFAARLTDPMKVLERGFGAGWEVFAPGFAYQVFAPPTRHVNIHEHALHLWGRVDGKSITPDFGAFGTI